MTVMRVMCLGVNFDFVTGHGSCICLTDTLNFVMGCLQFSIGDDDQLGAALAFDGGNCRAFLVQQIGRHCNRHDCSNFDALALVGLFLQYAQD
jgi:hypothetical protein